MVIGNEKCFFCNYFLKVEKTKVWDKKLYMDVLWFDFVILIELKKLIQLRTIEVTRFIVFKLFRFSSKYICFYSQYYRV